MLYDVSTSRPTKVTCSASLGYPKEPWREPQITIGLLIDAAGFTRREQRQAEVRRRAGQQHLLVCARRPYNAVARDPLAQRRIMWLLVHGGDTPASRSCDLPAGGVRDEDHGSAE